jgi:hypothetical protein
MASGPGVFVLGLILKSPSVQAGPVVHDLPLPAPALPDSARPDALEEVQMLMLVAEADASRGLSQQKREESKRRK